MNITEQVTTAEDLIKQAGAKAEDGDWVGAIHSYNQALLLDPNNPRAYGGRGLVRANLGDKHSAIEDCRNAAKFFLAQGKIANYEMVLDYIRRIEHK
ncbi:MULTISPECIES: tetratricopeptide repeat protein [unclassified Coleofasciculus]|uniref:tetratricopeptide repeat protein n=1 Tax=unclassified Coleofasciculus TaxID=2692782 RepID=UPI001880BE8B|nr:MULTISPECIES: tetratricopeptide repeat protein [unclassified Coleofasciculus]MBE9128118.1 tetratricopeptide repeat protein [Coleofasciculus sp. LEGE 07081]MBE9151190.1 tetratricopeptide repeat protein [Coleofasciculus sp. LEGE 07092]